MDTPSRFEHPRWRRLITAPIFERWRTLIRTCQTCGTRQEIDEWSHLMPKPIYLMPTGIDTAGVLRAVGFEDEYVYPCPVCGGGEYTYEAIY